MSTTHTSTCSLPLVGVSMRLLAQAHTGDVHDALSQDWGRFLTAVGIAWVPLPNRGGETLALVRHLGVGGFIFSGGGDAGDEPARDHTERLLLHHAQGQNLPIVGVCRGFQAIQLALGGNLVPVGGHVAVGHGLWNGRDIEGEAVRQVNSYHALGIAQCAAPLVPFAFSHEPCGAQHVEAAWAPGLLGIMWHPERSAQPEKRDVDMIRHFFGYPSAKPSICCTESI